MKKLILLPFMVLGSLASLRPGVTDPFLHSQWKCRPGRKIVQDPKYCDRIMLCGESPEKSVVQYCPNQMVFVRGRSCVPVNRGASHCQRRGVWKLETPNKVHHMCQSNYSRVSNKRVYTRTCILAKFPLYTALLDTYTTPCKSKTWWANFFDKLKNWNYCIKMMLRTLSKSKMNIKLMKITIHLHIEPDVWK